MSCVTVLFHGWGHAAAGPCTGPTSPDCHWGGTAEPRGMEQSCWGLEPTKQSIGISNRQHQYSTGTQPAKNRRFWRFFAHYQPGYGFVHPPAAVGSAAMIQKGCTQGTRFRAHSFHLFFVALLPFLTSWFEWSTNDCYLFIPFIPFIPSAASENCNRNDVRPGSVQHRVIACQDSRNLVGSPLRHSPLGTPWDPNLIFKDDNDFGIL